MRCSACNRQPPDESRFCPWCGRPLEDPTLATALNTDLDMTVASVLPALLPTGPSHATAGGSSGHGVSESLQFTAGTLLAGRYRIVRELGRGGMGIVYQADDTRLAHAVALKFLPPTFAADARRLAQFHNEVAVSRQISHPHVCRVYDIGEIDGHLFLSMEYVEGEDLAAVLKRRGALPEQEAIDLIRQICGGLAAVHARGVLHRDLKPANIMLTAAGHARLMDFGIAGASVADRSARVSEGTPAYMAPEQFAAADATAQSDIYALGLVMYEMLTGERLLSGGTTRELMQLQQSVASSIPATLDGRVSPELKEAVLRCLALDPAARPASVQALASKLQVVLLDVRTSGRRIVQVITQAAVIPLTMLAIGVFLRPTGTSLMAGLLLLAVGASLVLYEARVPLGWTVTYKGHQIRFHNHAIFGERLYIDGVLTDRGRVGFNVTLHGTIETGAGAGERITAHVQSHFTRIACRIVAESFAATPFNASETA